MNIQLIRSATLKITMSDHTFIIDPYLSAKHDMPSYTGVSPNPLVDLPFPPETVLDGCEMAVISHIHSDHFDPTAQELLPKVMPIFCQPDDEKQLRDLGFTKINSVKYKNKWRDITITRTPAQHGSGNVLDDMGQASGFIFEANGEPTLYWSGDTIWTPEIQDIIQQSQPDIIITHSGGAVWGDSVPIIMNVEQTLAVCQTAPESIVIATHMEALDHCTVTRTMLRSAAETQGIPSSQLIIPADGECIRLKGSPAKVVERINQ